ncbi:MAG: hypothetical protein ACREPV_09020 [Lysobacter sp.]
MNTFPHLPDQFHWSAQDLANAVPRRLFEFFAFDASLSGGALGPCANQPPRRPWLGSFLPTEPSPRFRVHS